MKKEELRQYRHLKREIEVIEQEIEGLRTSLLATPKLDGTPKGNGRPDRMADTVAKIVDLVEVLNKSMWKMINLRADIEDCISCLPVDKRLLMRLRYIEGLRWEAICVQMSYSWRQIHYIHNQILKQII